MKKSSKAEILLGNPRLRKLMSVSIHMLLNFTNILEDRAPGLEAFFASYAGEMKAHIPLNISIEWFLEYLDHVDNTATPLEIEEFLLQKEKSLYDYFESDLPLFKQFFKENIKPFRSVA